VDFEAAGGPGFGLLRFVSAAATAARQRPAPRGGTICLPGNGEGECCPSPGRRAGEAAAPRQRSCFGGAEPANRLDPGCRRRVSGLGRKTPEGPASNVGASGLSTAISFPPFGRGVTQARLEILGPGGRHFQVRGSEKSAFSGRAGRARTMRGQLRAGRLAHGKTVIAKVHG